jgi:hypothetical protein
MPITLEESKIPSLSPSSNFKNGDVSSPFAANLDTELALRE